MKTYLITGASSGIGYVIAGELLKKGNRCVLVARNGEALSRLETAYPKRAFPYSCDLRETDAVVDIFVSLREKGFLPLDGFIHCAGVAPLMRVDEADMNLVNETYTVNLFSFLEIMKYFVKEKNCRDGAAVVAISSVTAYRASNRQSVYAGTKAALDASVRCMARELIPRKIRVNTVVSGVVETTMLQELRKASPGLDEKLKINCPLGVMQPLDICHAIEYLLSDSATHITGVSMPVDSGFLL